MSLIANVKESMSVALKTSTRSGIFLWSSMHAPSSHHTARMSLCSP